MEIKKAFGFVLRRFRLEADLSQQELAEKCQLDRTFISMLERGIKQPSLETLFNLSAQLNLSPSELLANVESQLRRSRWVRQVHLQGS